MFVCKGKSSPYPLVYTARRA